MEGYPYSSTSPEPRGPADTGRLSRLDLAKLCVRASKAHCNAHYIWDKPSASESMRRWVHTLEGGILHMRYLKRKRRRRRSRKLFNDAREQVTGGDGWKGAGKRFGMYTDSHIFSPHRNAERFSMRILCGHHRAFLSRNKLRMARIALGMCKNNSSVGTAAAPNHRRPPARLSREDSAQSRLASMEAHLEHLRALLPGPGAL